MTDYGKVRSTVKPESMVMDDFSVWQYTNIKKVSENVGAENEFIGYEYNMIQYTKEEFILKQAAVNQELNDLINTILSFKETNKDKISIANQVNKLIQIQIQNENINSDDAKEIADLYPEWKFPKSYSVGYIFKYGLNSEGNPQLYKVIKEHTSEEDLIPEKTESIYKKL